MVDPAAARRRLEAELVLDGFEEPTPTEAFARERPETYERWIRRPSTFVCYRFRTRP